MSLKEAQVAEALNTATAALAEAVTSKDPGVRGMAAFRIGKYGVPEAKQTVSKLLKDEDPSVRRRAAAGLAALGEPAEGLLPLLRQAAADPEPAIREAALTATVRLHDVTESCLAISQAITEVAQQIGACLQRIRV